MRIIVFIKKWGIYQAGMRCHFSTEDADRLIAGGYAKDAMPEELPPIRRSITDRMVRKGV